MQKFKNNLKSLFKNQTFLVCLVFIVFALFIFLEHHYAWFYHDDYGYGSLSYAYDANITGHSFTIQELGDFLTGHYLNWGGRVLYFAVNCIILALGVHAWRIIQSIVIIGIFFIIYKLLSAILNKIPRSTIALLTVIPYGFISIMVARSGIFWVTASVLYIFPLLPLLGLILMYKQSSNHLSIFQKILMCILIFVSTFSYEQISAAAMCFVGLALVNKWLKTKHFPKFEFVLMLFAALGFGILMLAPGNAIRMAHPTSAEFYALPLLERLCTGLFNIFDNFFSNSNAIFLFIFLGLSIVTAFYNLKTPLSKHKAIRALNAIAALSNIIVFLFSTIFSANGGYVSFLGFLPDHLVYRIISLAILTAQCLLILYSYFSYLYKQKHYILTYFVICALASLCVMIVAPYFPSRSMLVFEFLFFPIFTVVLIGFYSNRRTKQYALYLYVSLTLISVVNVVQIIHGYHANDAANRYNDTILNSTSDRIQNGEQITSITLQKLPQPLYGSDQPYQEGGSYILNWIREYYNLPPDLEIIYE